jgi:hypothetical protein
MTKKTGTKKYPEIHFGIDELPYCCGIGVPCGFNEDVGYTGYWWGGESTKPKKLYKTREEQAEALYKNILSENGLSDQYPYLIISLVSNYSSGDKKGTAQLPELQDILIREEWTINQVFINPNHGNEITVFSKYFPEFEDEEEDEDEE